jgi:hypothetical protein
MRKRNFDIPIIRRRFVLGNRVPHNGGKPVLSTGGATGGSNNNGGGTPPPVVTPPADTPVYTLATPATTSAGVYDRGGRLLRTLWSNQAYAAGTYPLYWDGKDDSGTPVALNGQTFRVLSSRTAYQWEGTAIGNTSVPDSRKFHSSRFGVDVCFAGDNAYWALDYGEGWPAQWVTSFARPQDGKRWLEATGTNGQDTTLCTTDGTLVYWAGFDPLAPEGTAKTFVFATAIATGNRAAFASGTSITLAWGMVYSSALSYQTATTSLISGIAVQRSGSYLLVTRQDQDELQVLHKTTGALVQAIPMPAAGRCCVDSTDQLWVATGGGIRQYTINADGTLTATGVQVTGIGNVGSIDVSPDNTTLVIADRDAQVVKAFRTTDGAAQWTLGTAGGYATDATVTNQKFFWKSIDGYKYAFVKYTPDGGLYIGDPYNWRCLQLDSARTYTRTISWIPQLYKMAVDAANPARLLCEFREFAIDHSLPVDQCWTLKKNWGYPYTTSLYDTGLLQPNVVTFPNGRTYGLLRGTGVNNLNFHILEFVEGATLRISNTVVSPLTAVLRSDGSLTKWAVSNTVASATRYALTGYDSSNNPQWATAGTTLFSAPIPNFNPNKLHIEQDRITAFDISARQLYDHSDHHLAAFPIGGSAPLWRTARGTSYDYIGQYPAGGWFDNGNGVNLGTNGGGGFMSGLGSHVIWNYHGEFWKQSQANMYHHFDTATGLCAGMFGVTSQDNVTRQEAFPQWDGNAVSGALVQKDADTAYLYHNGETYGLHRWKITGLGTVRTDSFPVTAIAAAPAVGIDLLAGAVQKGMLADGIAGWRRSPAADYRNSNTDYFSVQTGIAHYDPLNSPDITAQYYGSFGECTASRTLGSNANTASWTLGGDIFFSTSAYNAVDNKGGCYVQVLDNTGRVICRFYRWTDRASSGGLYIKANDKVIYSEATAAEIPKRTRFWKPFSISASAGQLTFRYADFTAVTTAALTDAAALWNAPATLQLYFFTLSGGQAAWRLISVKNLRFRAV